MSRIARVIVADPPWSFGDKLPGKTRGADKQYKTLSLSDIQRFPLPDITDDAILFLWRVSSQVEEAYAVIRAWGFVPKAEIVWIKTTGTVSPEGEEEKLHFGMGHYTRASHETCVIATRGSFKVADRGIRSVFTAAVGKHSEKPQAFFDLVEKLCGAKGTQNGDAADDGGPFIELFARVPRPGWHTFGDELPGGYAWTPKTGGLVVNGTPVTLPPGTDLGAVPASVLAAAIGGTIIAPGVVQAPPLPEEGPSSIVPNDSKNYARKMGPWDIAIASANTYEEEPEPSEPPLPEDVEIKARPRGPLPAHVTADLGAHPAIVPEAQRTAYLRSAAAQGILTEEEMGDPANAWILLQYRAPAGFFRTLKPLDKSPLSQLAQDLAAHGMPVNLIVLSGWSPFQLDMMRLWVAQGGKPEMAPSILTEEVARNPKAEVPADHAAKAAARVRIPEGVPSLLESGASTVIENMSPDLAAVVAATEPAPKAKRGRKAKADSPQSAASILGWDAAIERANTHEGDDGATP